MNGEKELLERISRLVSARRYRVRIHAVRHMIEEGFGEEDVVNALSSRIRIVENYAEDARCLVLGYFGFGGARSPLHVVCDYSSEGLVDIVTAYIPQKPWWNTPTRRGKLQ